MTDFNTRMAGLSSNPLFNIGIGLMSNRGQFGPGLQQGMQLTQQGIAAQQKQQQALAQQEQQKQEQDLLMQKFRADQKQQAELQKYKSEVMQGMSPDQQAAMMAFPEVGKQLMLEKYKKEKAPTGFTIGEGGELVPQQAYWDMKKSVSAAGAPSISNVIEAQKTPLTKANQSKIQMSEIESRDKLSRLENMMQSFDPEMLTYGSQAKGALASLAEKILPGMVSEGQKEGIKARTKFTQDVMTNVNSTIKEITGAAMSETEGVRIMKALPNMDDSPTQFKAKMGNAMGAVQEIIARKSGYQTEGVGDAPAPVSPQAPVQQAPVSFEGWKIKEIK